MEIKWLRIEPEELEVGYNIPAMVGMDKLMFRLRVSY